MARTTARALMVTWAAAGMMGAAGTAVAAPTQVNLQAGFGTEPGVVSIYQAIADNPAAAGLSASDVNTGTGQAAMRRVDEALDRIFFDGTANVVFSALYWGATPDATGVAVHDFYISRNGVLGAPVFSVGGDEGGQPGQVFSPADFPSSDTLRFVAFNQSSGLWANTDPTAINPDGQTNTLVEGERDRVITFDVTGFDLFGVADGTTNEAERGDPILGLPELPGEKRTFLLFFETGFDGDYQDLVVVAHSFRLIPLPSAGAMAVAGLLGAGLVTRRRRV